MKRLLIGTAFVLGSLLVVSGAARAQAVMAGDEMFIEMLKHDVRQAKTDVITDVMKFSVDDAAAFWPIYNEYRTELDKLSDSRVELMKHYAGIYWSMTNQQAEEMAGKWLDFQNTRTRLTNDLYKKLAKAMSPVQALRAVQLEHRLNLLVDLQIVNELPMIE